MTAQTDRPEKPKSGRAGSLAVLTVALVVSLLLAEGLVRLAGAVGLVNVAPSLAEIPVPDEIQQQVNAGPSGASGPLYVGDPVLRHRMAANWSGAFPETALQSIGRSNIPIRTNALGLRSAEVTLPKPEGVFRIIALGDSVTFGWGVREEDTYPAQLGELLAALHPDQRFEVINAGVSGYGTWQESAWLQQMAGQLQPDLVVVQVHLNDVADNLWATASVGEGQSSWLTQHSALARLVQRLLLAGRGGGTGSGSCDSDWHERARRVCWDKTLALLEDMGQTASGRGATVALLPMPMRWQVEPGVADPRAWVDSDRYQEVLRAFAAQRGWTMVDPLPAFQNAAAAGQSLFLDVGHPNETGQRLLAQELLRTLSDAGQLP